MIGAVFHHAAGWPAGSPGLASAPLRALRDHWGDPMIPVTSLVVAAAMLLGALGAIGAWRWWRQLDQQSLPWWTFHSTARHMGLTLREQWLLVLIARHERLPTPLTLMLSRRTLLHHARQYLAGRSRNQRLAAMRRVLAIRRALFGMPAGASPAELLTGVSG